MMQLEFPFTRPGQLYAYNAEQSGHMRKLYYDYLRNSGQQHCADKWHAWELMYVDSGMALQYAKEHKHLFETPTIESQNEKVLMRWERNATFKGQGLDDLL